MSKLQIPTFQIKLNIIILDAYFFIQRKSMRKKVAAEFLFGNFFRP